MTRPTATRADLHVVGPAAETPAQAAARLQREAADLAGEAIRRMLADLGATEAALAEIAGLTVAPHGVRDECRQLAETIGARASTMRAILGRGA